MQSLLNLWNALSAFLAEPSVQSAYDVMNGFNALIWGPPMIFLLLFLGIYFTVRLNFLQKYTWPAMKLSVAKVDSEGMVSSFGSLAVMIGATVGTGSIIGVTTAVAEGGPGALFWMIVAGFFSFAIKYCECLIAFKYRVKLADGEYVGGPMYYLANVLKYKWLAVVFAVGTLLMGLTAGSALQSNSIADALREGYNLNPWYIGVIVAFLSGIVIIGGVKRIAAYSEWLVPIMGGLYLLLAFIVIVMNFSEVPSAILVVIKSAFTGKAAVGGAVGVGIMALVQSIIPAITAGFTRAVLATEAGLGSASIAAAAAKTRSATQMAIVSATSVFWAIFICSLTGIVIVLAGDWQNPNVYAANLCNSAFKTVPYIGTPILIFSLVIFSFTTIIGWGYYTEKALQFLCKGSNKLIKPSRVLFIALVFIGAWIGTSFSWDFFITDSLTRTAEANVSTRFMWALVILTMTMMTLPNIWALWCFRKVIVKTTAKNLKNIVGKKN
ncbi:MAG: sodium:alanine symporter family protein [Elusimicrobium sp.]|uniref:Sodium:alanine symporter family protein n=1 Tax=Candidatus Avelusimicrobium gallicola TaxID=2562704 RepID=A0A928HIM8_9BACT|nr:sodium:alanine symporter family protein [Elusimicrobium sp.]